MNRRDFIHAGAVMIGATTIAGCVGQGTNNGGTDEVPSHDIPSYSDWIPVESQTPDSGVFFTHLDLDAFEGLDDDEEPMDEDEEDEDDTVEWLIEQLPILGLPMYASFITPVYMLGIMFYPFTGDMLPEEDETGEPIDDVEGIDTSAMTVVDNTILFHGSFDPRVFETRYSDDFEMADERDGFTVYVGADGFAEGMSYAVSDETVIVGMTGSDDDQLAEQRVTSALDRRLDDVDRLVGDEDGEWLFETTGQAPMVFGMWETDDLAEALDTDAEEDDEPPEDGQDDGLIDENPVLEPVESVINNLWFEAEDGEMRGLEARFSGIYPEGETPSESEVEEHLLGDEDVPGDVVIDETRVHVTASFEEDMLDPDQPSNSL